MSVQIFGRGRYPLPEIWRKNGVCCKAYSLSTSFTASTLLGLARRPSGCWLMHHRRRVSYVSHAAPCCLQDTVDWAADVAIRSVTRLSCRAACTCMYEWPLVVWVSVTMCISHYCSGTAHMVLEHCIQQHDFVTNIPTGTFTQYAWNIAQMMFNYTFSEKMTAPSNFFHSPGIKLATTPTMQSVNYYDINFYSVNFMNYHSQLILCNVPDCSAPL